MSASVREMTGGWRRAALCGLGLIVLVAGVMLIAGCKTPVQIIGDITVQEAFDLIEEEQDNPDFAIIDVRTPEEYTEGHIENAVNIDFRTDDFEDRISELDREKTYVIYCRSGVRSAGAFDVMERLDFHEAYNVLEGITGWTDAGFPVVK